MNYLKLIKKNMIIAVAMVISAAAVAQEANLLLRYQDQ